MDGWKGQRCVTNAQKLEREEKHLPMKGENYEITVWKTKEDDIYATGDCLEANHQQLEQSKSC